MERQTTPGIRTFHPAPRDKVRAEARLRGEQWAAAASGIVEGILEGLERYELAREAEQALAAAGETARAIGQEGRMQAQDPQLQGLGHGIEDVATNAWERTRGTSEELAHETKEWFEGTRDSATQRLEDARENIMEKAEELTRQARWQWIKAQNRAEGAWEDMRIRGRAIGEAGHRASQAPRLVAKDVGQAFAVRRKAMGSTLALYAVAGIVGITTFVVLTIAVVAGLNGMLGAPLGTFVAALVYGIVAIGAVLAAKQAKGAGQERAKKHMEDAKRQVTDIGRPLRMAFQRDLQEYKG